MSFAARKPIPPQDRFRILGLLARGGMAEVYLARERDAQGREREVVLKRLLPNLQSDPEFVQMFHDEANIASQLRHPNIVQLYEFGQMDGSWFLAMELARGVNLRDVLTRDQRTGQRMHIGVAMQIITGALDALQYAHGFRDVQGRHLNLVHRDVSPQNIVVTYDGRVKLIDFGVAKADGKGHQTQVGLLKGKVDYMSPEQLGGDGIDGRSDLFALSAVFYELLTGVHPFFDAACPNTFVRILTHEPPAPTTLVNGIPPELDALVMRGLKKDPSYRYQSAAEMRGAIDHLVDQWGVRANADQVGSHIRTLFRNEVVQEQSARGANDEHALVQALAVDAIKADAETAGEFPAVQFGDGPTDLFEADTIPPGPL